jgi:hypothetical protein
MKQREIYRRPEALEKVEGAMRTTVKASKTLLGKED